MKSLRCATLDGFEAKEVVVESTLTKGLPAFGIVGLASLSINEAKERVKSALLANGFKFPPKRITINLSPSELSKSGSHFDLAIALLIALDKLEKNIDEWFVFGELGLDGRIKESSAIYPLILSLANQRKIKKAIVPAESLEKLSKIPGIELYGFETLPELLAAFEAESFTPSKLAASIPYPFVQAGGESYYYSDNYTLDFYDIKGQEIAKRAAFIAAAGFHNILLEGSPGCGKSMIAQRLVEILPPLCLEEILEISKIRILSGEEPDFEPKRKIVSPHHSSTPASIFGGGTKNAKIGEVGRAHLGALFFDEVPHFSKKVLEALREPMQDRVIRISRVNSKVEYKSDFIFVGAMNPCPCGNLLDETKECRCSDLEIQKYQNRLSDPFLDRIDLHVTMQKVDKEDKPSFSSKELHQKVLEAFVFAKKRGQKSFNATLDDSEIEQYCVLEEEAKDVLDMAIDRFALSFRSIKSIQKVARTIADLEQSMRISKAHMLEALSYRRRER